MCVFTVYICVCVCMFVCVHACVCVCVRSFILQHTRVKKKILIIVEIEKMIHFLTNFICKLHKIP